MQLPFTTEQFFDLLAAYNEALWPGLAVLWMASLVRVCCCSRRAGHRIAGSAVSSRPIGSGRPWHTTPRSLRESTPPRGSSPRSSSCWRVVFLAVVQGRLSFAPWRNAWAPVAWVLIAYCRAGINAVQHFSVARIPAFGVPCPTMIFTAGVLMLATPRSWRLSSFR